MYMTEQTRHIAIHNEMDIVTLRHTVRQFGRAIGLDLPRQAKVTVAISAVARAFVNDSNGVVFTVKVVSRMTTPVLEIICLSPDTPHVHNGQARDLEERLNVPEVQLLVDEFAIDTVDGQTTLTMRMKLGPS